MLCITLSSFQPSFGLLQVTVFNAQYQHVYWYIRHYFGCLKLILQKISRDGVTRAIYPELLQVLFTCLFLSSVLYDLEVSFPRRAVLGLHFLSLSVLNMLLCFLLVKTLLLKILIASNFFSYKSLSLFAYTPKVLLVFYTV